MDSWKNIVKNDIAPELEKQINEFETQMELMRIGKIDEKILRELSRQT